MIETKTEVSKNLEKALKGITTGKTARCQRTKKAEREETQRAEITACENVESVTPQ